MRRSDRPPSGLPDESTDTAGPTEGWGTREFAVPVHQTLDGFAQEVGQGRGLSLGELTCLSRLEIQTRNSRYSLTLLNPAESQVLIQGGRFFDADTEAIVCGSSYGGTLLKLAWIGLGMRMELMSEGRRIVTSPVVSVDVLDDSTLPGPF